LPSAGLLKAYTNSFTSGACVTSSTVVFA
jgi:hypothetical protein